MGGATPRPAGLWGSLPRMRELSGDGRRGFNGISGCCAGTSLRAPLSGRFTARTFPPEWRSRWSDRGTRCNWASVNRTLLDGFDTSGSAGDAGKPQIQVVRAVTVIPNPKISARSPPRADGGLRDSRTRDPPPGGRTKVHSVGAVAGGRGEAGPRAWIRTGVRSPVSPCVRCGPAPRSTSPSRTRTLRPWRASWP